MTNNLTLEFCLNNPRDTILFLIYKELNDISFQNRFYQAGLDLSTHMVDLGELILTRLGYTEISDELWEFYFETMNHYAMVLDNQAGKSSILKCYYALMNFKQ